MSKHKQTVSMEQTLVKIWDLRAMRSKLDWTTALYLFYVFAVLAFGVTHSVASYMLMPLVISVAIGAPLFGRILDRTGSRFVVLLQGDDIFLDHLPPPFHQQACPLEIVPGQMQA